MCFFPFSHHSAASESTSHWKSVTFCVQDAEKAEFNDEAELAAARRTQALVAQQERLREAYNELKYTAPDKVEAMRDQEMTRMQMSLAYRTGADKWDKFRSPHVTQRATSNCVGWHFPFRTMTLDSVCL
jgi:hypothetical protein